MSISSDVRDALHALQPGQYLRAADIEGSPGAVATALSRECSKRSDVVRVRKGLYWKGVSSRFGAGKPDELETAVIAAGSGAGPAGWSALSLLGLTTQVPSVASIAVPGRQMVIRGMTAHKRSNIERVHLNHVEVAVLEVVRDEWFERSRRGLPNRVKQLVEDGVIDLERLATVARREPSARVRARVGALTATA